MKKDSNSYSYPQIRGLTNHQAEETLNHVLKTIGEPASLDSTSTMQTSYSMLMKRGSFLEMMLYSYNYAKGAAHGMPGQIPVMMNLQDGSVYQIGALFKNGANYLSRLSDGVRAQDKQHVLDTFSPFQGATNHDGFFVSNEGITVFFQPYEWTPYALGFPQFTVPYPSIQDIMDTNGLFWKALHDSQAKVDENIEAADTKRIQSLGYVRVDDVYSGFAEAAFGNGKSLYVFTASRKSVPDGTAQKLFFFLNDKYLGTDTAKDHATIEHLAPIGKASVSVMYPSDNGDFSITYRWDGQKLLLTPPFPNSYSNWSRP